MIEALEWAEGKRVLIYTTSDQEIVIDYTDMGERVGGYRCLLVAVDAYTGWPEAIPAENKMQKQ